MAFTPDGLFFGDADPRAAFANVRGSTNLPMNDFAALNRRDSLADALAPKAAAARNERARRCFPRPRFPRASPEKRLICGERQSIVSGYAWTGVALAVAAAKRCM